MRAFGAYLYVSQGSSYRKVARLLEDFSILVSHVAVWSWVQRLEEELEGEVFRRRRRKVIIADETKIKTKKGWIYVFTTIDLVRRIFVTYIDEHSMPEVVFQLNEEGIETKRGKGCLAWSVEKILDNKIYIGQYEVAGVELRKFFLRLFGFSSRYLQDD